MAQETRYTSEATATAEGTTRDAGGTTTVTKIDTTRPIYQEPIREVPVKPISPVTPPTTGLKAGVYDFVITTVDQFGGPTYHKFKVEVRPGKRGSTTPNVQQEFAFTEQNFDKYTEIYQPTLDNSTLERQTIKLA